MEEQWKLIDYHFPNNSTKTSGKDEKMNLPLKKQKSVEPYRIQ